MNVIFREDNGIEFFTVAQTGESGMSQTGLAKLCGVDKMTISRLLRTLADDLELTDLGYTSAQKKLSKLPEYLQRLKGKDLYLSQKLKKQGGRFQVVKSEVCAAAIAHYASKNKVAHFSLAKFTQIGIDTWIQNITGWKPSVEQPEEPQFKPSDSEIAEYVPDKNLDLLSATLAGLMQTVEQMKCHNQQIQSLESG